MIIGLMITRNEQGRYLEQVIKEMKKVCEKIVVADDDSEDSTPEICANYGCEVYSTGSCLWEGKESELRKYAFELATKEAKNGDWILCLDADEIPVNIDRLPLILDVLNKREDMSNVNGIGFRLYDMWNEHYFRDDELWTAHFRLWTMCIKYEEGKQYIWNENGLHCGRFPLNAGECLISAPIDIKHMGWATEEDRIKKYQRYMTVDPKGVYGILEQYESILDEYPRLRRFEE